MSWLLEMLRDDSVTSAILILSTVSAFGLLLGAIRIFGISLGFAGVLFMGLLFGHFKLTINPHVLEFVREFGLVLFVYTIGIQMGPGFFASLRKQGLPLNLMAASIVILGMIITALIQRLGHIDMAVAVGLFSGATTNTPSLGAAQQALKGIEGLAPEAMKYPGLGYAVTYPFGILGIILSLLLIRAFFRIRISDEVLDFERQSELARAGLSTMNIEVQNPNLEGFAIKRIPALPESGVVISRVWHGVELQVATSDTVIHLGDVLLAIGKPENLEKIRVTVGQESKKDLRAIPSRITSRRIVVTRSEVVGKSPRALDLFHRYGVTLTRVIRADMEFAPTANFQLQFADRVVAVGDERALKMVEQEFGNSLKSLDHPQVIPVFVGLAIGVIVGSVPIFLPGVPAPVRLGLAGGPLIVAILLSWLGHFRSLVWYLPASANFILRELGILLFLACVGIKAGDRFWATLVEGQGLVWMGYGVLITLVPILLVGIFARALFKLNYLTLCGLLAGSMTDPPALAYAHSMTGSDTPAISYATVYPLTMLLRVIGAQLLVLLLS